jgi:hypothetical protein
MQTDSPRLRELTVSYRIRRDDDGQPIPLNGIVTNPTDAVAALSAILAGEPSEVFGVLCLTTRHRIIGYHEVSRGALDATIVTRAKYSVPRSSRTPRRSSSRTITRAVTRRRAPTTATSLGAWSRPATSSASPFSITSSLATASTSASAPVGSGDRGNWEPPTRQGNCRLPHSVAFRTERNLAAVAS